MKLRNTAARTLAKQCQRQINESTVSDDDVTFGDVGPFSPLSCVTSADDIEDKNCGDHSYDNDSSLPMKSQRKKKANVSKNAKRLRNTGSKQKSVKSCVEDEPLVDDPDPDLGLIIDDKQIGKVIEVLEQLPEDVANDYCSYLVSQQNKNEPSNKKPLKTLRMLLDTLQKTKCQYCAICEAKFEKPSDLKKHLKRRHGSVKGYFHCALCQKKFKSFSVFCNHLYFTHSRNFKCPHCNLFFARIMRFVKHIREAHPGRHRFVCSLCSREFRTINVLMMHLNTHTGLVPHKCPYCPKAYPSMNSLGEHQKFHLKDNYRFKCDKCDKIFVSGKLRNHHMLIHGTERRFKCKLCDKAFKTAENLFSHRLSHGRRKFPCDTCGKRFTSISALKTHCVRMKHVKGICVDSEADIVLKMGDNNDGTDDYGHDLIITEPVDLDPLEIELNKQPLHLEHTLLTNMVVEMDSDNE